MSIQHVQQLQADYGEVRERDTYTRGGRPMGMRAACEETVESGYVAVYLSYRLGQRKTLPPLIGLTRQKAARLRDEVDRELAR